MQRVATDLFNALSTHPSVKLTPVVLRTSWASTHRKVPFFLIRARKKIIHLIESGNADAIIFSSMVTGLLCIVLQGRAKQRGIPLCVIVHGLDVTTRFPVWQWLVRKVFGCVDFVFPVSSATAEACRERGLSPEKFQVIPNGISDDRFAGSIDRDSARNQIASLAGLQSRRDVFVCVSVGRMVKRKGFDWFVRHVMPGLDAKIHFVLAGEGPMSDDVIQAANDAGVEDRVHMLGRVSESDLHALYVGSDVFVMPNVHIEGDMEGFGVVMLEAGLSGLPVVAANIEGISDVIDEGKNGLFVDSEDGPGFITTIAHLRENPNALAELASTARKSVLDRFSWDRVADRYVEAVRSGVDRS